MPRTRFEIDRDAKVEAILTKAEERLLEGGYSALSIAGLARELGVAGNSIYWYFPSKDHLFVAVLRHRLGTLARQKPRKTDVMHVASWILDRLEEFQPLRVALHERAMVSDEVREFADEFNAIMHALIQHAVASRVAEEDVTIATDAFATMVEGLLVRRLPRARRDAIVRYTLERLVR